MSSFPRRRIGVNLRIFVVLLSVYKTDEASERHSREGGNPGFSRSSWTPACAGVTKGDPCCIRKHFKIHWNSLKLTPMHEGGNPAMGLSGQTLTNKERYRSENNLSVMSVCRRSRGNFKRVENNRSGPVVLLAPARFTLYPLAPIQGGALRRVSRVPCSRDPACKPKSLEKI